MTCIRPHPLLKPMPGEHKINTGATNISPSHTPSNSPPSYNGPVLDRNQRHTMGTTTYTQPFKQGFAHAPNTTATDAPAVSKPWYASLDSLPESGKFNEGHINIPSQHGASYDHQPEPSPQPRMKSRRFSNAEIERVIEEDLEIADDIPAPWPSEFEEASPPNTIPVTDLRNHHGRRISHFELPSPPKSPAAQTARPPPANDPINPPKEKHPTQEHHPHTTARRGGPHYPRASIPPIISNPNVTQEANYPRPPKAVRKAARQEQDPLQFPLEVEAPSQVEKAGAWCTACTSPSTGDTVRRGEGGNGGPDTPMEGAEEGGRGEGSRDEEEDEGEGEDSMTGRRGRKDSGALPTMTAVSPYCVGNGEEDSAPPPQASLLRHCNRSDAQVISGGAGPTRCFCGLSRPGENGSGEKMRRVGGGGGGGGGRLDW
ncbi:hypothetical protein D0868_01613 [Hortaea werneckii]|uniref:Uncharacterized protein n=1 Tax=Hortaea werneckii TaxID=91943 RepID=A0A3M6ZG76_HORWE|nr:hypothetical protein D0868_01613 [Hortaea werneckii]